jgi:penicillin-binding protein 2
MKSRLFNLLIVLTLLAGCTGAPGGTSLIPSTSTPDLPAPSIEVTRAPDALSQLKGFFEAWKANNYEVMYGYLSATSQQNISQDDFTQRYRNAMNNLGLQDLGVEVVSSTINPQDAQVNVRVVYRSSMVGDLTREMTYNMRMESNQWRIDWEEGLILPELRGGNTLAMDYETPNRGEIFDRKGNLIVSQTEAVAFGVNPAFINEDQEATLLYELANLTGMAPGDVQAKYQNYYGQDWYVPIGEASLEETNKRYGILAGLGGMVIMNNYTSRYYWKGGIAPQTVGYTSPLQPEQFDDYVRKGYPRDARIGQMGIEQWAEDKLAGKSGGTLYVVSPQGSIVSYLGKSEAQKPSSVYMTIDSSLQFQAQQALTGFRGSIVVLERDSGRVLAIVSSPEYDPNLFEPNNYNSSSGLGILVNDPNTPLLNRATQGGYPLGSVFKLITFAAAIESGTYTKDLTFNCEYTWNEFPGRTFNDWTYDRYLRELQATGEGTTKPSGVLTLTQGLIRSCNPWFYHIGFDLFSQGRVTAVADMARGFGLGSPTGIVGVNEIPGQIVNPPTLLDAVNQAIGQGEMLVTPLQVARFIAAIGNGGTLYRPQVVEKFVDANGAETPVFKPEAAGTLPIKPETLAAIREGMLGVIESTNPRGTAEHRFRGFEYKIYGKTGTAETGIPGYPHSWFAGYTDQQIEGVPDIAIAVIAENAGEGSEFAAQIFRRVVEIYFKGRPVRPYSWETSIGVTRTPTPFGFEGTQTAQPRP